MPILGIIASQQPGKITTLAYDSIATVNVGAGGSSSITFSSIPSTYKHLQIRALARTDNGTTGGSSMNMQFNSDTATNYSRHFFEVYSIGSTTTPDVFGGTNANYITVSTVSTGGVPSSIFGASVIDILEYGNTSIYKTARSVGGYDNNGNGSGYAYAQFASGNWRSNSAITSITLTGNGNFVQYSSFALYGIKG